MTIFSMTKMLKFIVNKSISWSRTQQNEFGDKVSLGLTGRANDIPRPLVVLKMLKKRDRRRERQIDDGRQKGGRRAKDRIPGVGWDGNGNGMIPSRPSPTVERSSSIS